MALVAKTVLVGVAPTLLSAPQVDGLPGSSLAVRVPAGGQLVFVGGSAVTAAGAAQGWPLAAGESLFLDIDAASRTSATDVSAGEDVYAVVAVGTQSVNVLARGL
jgi:hypothetical protein